MSQLSINFWSAILSGPIDINVLTPDIEFGMNAKEYFETHKAFKAIWLLHGGLCDHNSWIRNTNIYRYIQGRDVFVIIPNGLNSDFSNHPEFADGFNMSDFIMDELMPFVFNWLPVSSDPQDNFLVGYSLGAAACWMFGLQYPDRFAGIAPIGSLPKDYSYLKPYRNLDSAEFRSLVGKDPKAFPAGYGNRENGIHPKEVNMIAKYANVGDFLDSWEHSSDRFWEMVKDKKSFPQVYLPCDSGEQYYDEICHFKNQVEQTGAADKITFKLTDEGISGYEFCDKVLPDILDYFQI